MREVAGERVDILVMVPSGRSPHTYKPSPAQLEKLRRVEIYFAVGSEIEFERIWMGKLKEINPKMRIINCSEGILFLDDDPHVWLSPRNAKIMVENICRAFVDFDPQNRDLYIKNRDLYIEELDELDGELKRAFAKLKKRKFLVFHPAWAYFAKDYGLEQIAVEIEGGEPGPRDLERLVEMARREGMKVIFASPGFEAERARAIAEAIGGRVEIADPLASDYVSNLRRVSDALVRALGGVRS